MTRSRTIGLASLLPLYLALATALGYVDYHVRPFVDHSFTTYTPAVVAGTADPPARYRVLAPRAYEALVRASHLSRDDAWVAFRWLCLVATLLAGHIYFRTWFSTGASLAGNLLVMGLLPLTFTNSWGNPDHLVELFLFTLASACVVRERLLLFLGVLVLAAFNRETSFLLVIVFLCAREMNRRHLQWAAAAGVLWLAVYAGLRYQLGYVGYDPLQLKENLKFLFWWPIERDVYYRLYSWFFAIMLVPPVWLIARSWAAQPRFTRVAAGVATPLMLLVGLTFSSVIEPRIFTPLLPLLVPGVLFALFSAERTPSARASRTV